MPENSSSTKSPKKKQAYKKPEIKTEKVSIAALGQACNGRATGSSGRKANMPCVIMLS